jgi:pimeloyl-ACP methyl ester carboxylesterase
MEPPAPPPTGHRLYGAFEAGRIALAERSVRRQSRFTSIEELAEKYEGQSAFSCFQEGAAQELAASILQESEAGFVLRCTPQAESRYYETNFDDGLLDRADHVGCPVLMLAGRNDLAHAGTPAQIAVELAHAGGYDYVELAGATHMMPLERPEAVAAYTRAFLQAGWSHDR